MTRQPNDDELRARFAALRQEDSRLLPQFRGAQQALAATPRLSRWVPAAALASAAVAVLWLAGRDRDTSDRRGLDLAATVWRAPTDFLLETPGRDLLRQVPDVGHVSVPSLPNGLPEENRGSG
ncbi:MAG: hypothetical protein HY337_08170 [Gemmatimonadetes bacterium]|nr:hypothetical protein [Gemmatimonadota bacterium]